MILHVVGHSEYEGNMTAVVENSNCFSCMYGVMQKYKVSSTDIATVIMIQKVKYVERIISSNTGN